MRVVAAVLALGLIAGCGANYDTDQPQLTDPYAEAAQYGACPAPGFICDYYFPYLGNPTLGNGKWTVTGACEGEDCTLNPGGLATGYNNSHTAAYTWKQYGLPDSTTCTNAFNVSCASFSRTSGKCSKAPT